MNDLIELLDEANALNDVVVARIAKAKKLNAAGDRLGFYTEVAMLVELKPAMAHLIERMGEVL
jgi:hypothetical protein